MAREDRNETFSKSISKTFGFATWAHKSCCGGDGVRALFWPQTPKLQQISQVVQCSQVLWNLTNIRSTLQQGRKKIQCS